MSHTRFLVETRPIKVGEWYLDNHGTPYIMEKEPDNNRAWPVIIKCRVPTPEGPGIYTAYTLDGKRYFALVKEPFSTPMIYNSLIEEVAVDPRTIVVYRRVWY